ncbi:MAG: FtsW/RodA/SpoVE family cell cycle protein, partial [bacterium]|nr:FtsW/RodA/SpoVE family cell cycle protein [bacterium]
MRYRQFSIIRRRTDGQGVPDTALLAAIALLFVLGLFALASSSSYYSFTRFGSWYRVVLYQMAAGGIPGLLLFSLFFSVDYRRWQRWGVFWLVLTLGSLLLVFVPGLGEVRNGARSWVSLGPLTAQPAEAVKLTALIFLSGWLARVGFHDARSIGRGLVPFLLFTGAVLGLIALQPDLGTLLVVAVILATVYYVSGAQLLYVGSLAIVSLALL